MPHVIIKMYPGRSDELKARAATEVTRVLVTALGCSPASVSVGIEDIRPEDWPATVHEPDIAGKPETIFRPPGISALAAD